MKDIEIGLKRCILNHNFKPNDISEVKSYHDNGMKYYSKIVRVHHKFIDRMYSKYPALTNPFNKLSLQQILNKEIQLKKQDKKTN